MTHPLRNPKDPLLKAGPEATQELLRRLGNVCDGFPAQVVLDAALNLAITVVRENKGTWPDAEKAMTEIHGRVMLVLKGHYDMVSGRKKGIFPYDQVIVVPHTMRKQ